MQIWNYFNSFQNIYPEEVGQVKINMRTTDCNFKKIKKINNHSLLCIVFICNSRLF